jgi:hypothetical protein
MMLESGAETHKKNGSSIKQTKSRRSALMRGGLLWPYRPFYDSALYICVLKKSNVLSQMSDEALPKNRKNRKPPSGRQTKTGAKKVLLARRIKHIIEAASARNGGATTALQARRVDASHMVEASIARSQGATRAPEAPRAEALNTEETGGAKSLGVTRAAKGC